MDDELALVDLDVDVLLDVDAGKFEAHERVLAVSDNLGGRAETAEYPPLQPRIELPGGAAPQRHLAHRRISLLRRDRHHTGRLPIELELTTLMFHRRVRRQRTAHTPAATVVRTP